MSMIDRLRLRPRGTTRALLTTTALSATLMAAPAWAEIVDCGPAPSGGGSVECTTAHNTYPNGITYVVPDDLTIVMDDGVVDHRVNAGGNNDALTVTAQYAYNHIVITGPNADVTADAGMRDGVYVYHSYSSAQGGTDITVRNVTGQTNGIAVNGGGDVNITAASAVGDLTGVFVSGLTAGHATNIHVGNAVQIGGGGNAAIVVLGSVYGDVYVQVDHAISDLTGVSITGGTGAHVGVNATLIDATTTGVRTTSSGGTDIVVGHVNAATGVYATSSAGTGVINVTADNINATGRGIDAVSAYGGVNVTVTNGGSVSTTASSSQTIRARNGVGSAENVTVTTTGATVTASGNGSAGIVAQAYGTGSAVVNAGSVSTTNVGSGNLAILAESGSGEVTVNLGDGTVSTLGSNSTGVIARADGVGGSVDITQTAGSVVDTSGYNSHGIIAVAFSTGDITIDADGQVSTHGPGGAGFLSGAPAIAAVNLIGPGDISVTSNSTSTQGDYSAGVFAVAAGGDITIHSTTSSTQGNAAPGIYALSQLGDVTITAGTVITHGVGAYGISGHAYDGSVAVTATGDVTTAGFDATGIDARGYAGVTITSLGQVHTGNATGIFASSFGPVIITSHVVVSDLGLGIRAASDYGSVTVTADSTTINRSTPGVAIYARAEDGNVTVTAGVVNANRGADVLGIGAYAYNGDVAVTASEVSTGGTGIDAISTYGNSTVTVTPGGHVTTFGDEARGLNVSAAYYGDASVVATGATIVTTGYASDGIHVRAGDEATGHSGNASVTGGTVTTSGDYSDGVDVRSIYGTATANVASVTTAGHDAYGVKVNGYQGASATVGTVHTSGTYSDGVEVSSYNGDVSATATSVTTTGDYSSGVGVSADNGDASATVGTVQTSGAYARGVFVSSEYGAASATVSSATTAGSSSDAVRVRGYGDATATVGTAQTSGDFSDGVDVRSFYGKASATVTSATTSGQSSNGVTVNGYGDATATVGTVSTSGVYASGVEVSSVMGNVSVTSASVTTSGTYAGGVLAYAYQGGVTVTSGTVRTSGAGSVGIFANAGENGNVSVTSTDLATTGASARGISASTFGSGAVSVTSGVLSTSGVYASGIDVFNETGAVTLSATTTSATGAGSDGIDVSTTTGNVTGTAGTVTAARDGVSSFSYGSTQTWTLGTVTAGSYGVLAENTTGHSTTLNLTNVLAGQTAALVGYGAATVNIASGGNVRGGLGYGVVFESVDSGVLNNAGKLSAGSGIAVFASSDSGPVTINNTGEVQGAVILGDAADSFVNASTGRFSVSGSPNFGGGADVFGNSGLVAFDVGQTPATVTFNGLEQFNNTGGLIDMRGRGAGDKLILSGGFAGSGDSRVGLDVFLGGPTSAADMLQVGGAVTGTTSLLIHDTNTGDGGLAPDGIVVVDASAGSVSAGAFTLHGGPINKGLFTYDLYLRNDKRYVIASRWSPTAEQSPFLTTALEGLFQESQGNIDERLAELRANNDIADSGTVQLAALASDAAGPLPRGHTDDNGVWIRLAAGSNDRIASRSQTVLGVTTTDNLDFTQSYVAIQGGVDHVFHGAGGTWIAGGSLGYLDSTGSFDKGGSFNFTGPTAALYLEYLKGGLFGEVAAKGDWLNLKYRSMAGAANPGAHTYGVSGTVGYRMHGSGWFAEPEGSLSYGVGRIDNFNLGGAGFVFHDGETLRGRAGLSLGQTFMVNHGRAILEPTITAAAVKEFLGANLVDINSGPGLRIGDGAKPTWGEFGGGVSLIDPSSGLSAFVQGKYEGLSKINTGFGFKAGVRWSF